MATFCGFASFTNDLRKNTPPVAEVGLIGTLDAIHLATALLIRDQLGLDAFLTHDTQLATAATAMGFVVQGI